MVGLPCNQFTGQEPGSAEEIAEFCSATYGVTFPMTEKIDVNGDDRHEIYATLVEAPNEKGEAGDVTWNFEKFLVDATGTVVARFRPQVVPDDPRLVAAIQALDVDASFDGVTPTRVTGAGVLSATGELDAADELLATGYEADQARIRPVMGGRSARVTMPGCAATTYGTALVTGIAV